MSTTIKCYHCGAYNVDEDYCTQCHVLINAAKRRDLEFEEAAKKRAETEEVDRQSTKDFIHKFRNHNFFMVRIVAGLVYYVWVVVMAIGAFLAWLFTTIAA